MTSQAMDQTGGVSLVSGKVLPPWDGLEGKYQDAWITSARTVEAAVLNRDDDAA